MVLLTVSSEEYTNESFSQAITGYLASSVPSCVDTQISLSDLEWSGGGGSELRYPNVFGAVTV